jgi:membrane protein insertase Oxa1/YidC/SpoIIIJ
MFTFSSLVYISSYPLGMVHYFITVVYFVWWLFITSEYKLFGSTIAWIWVIAPILVIPSVGIIMNAIYGLNIMIGILFVALLVYVYTYFTWANYKTTGFNLIDLKPVIYQVRERIKKSQRSEINKKEREMLK